MKWIGKDIHLDTIPIHPSASSRLVELNCLKTAPAIKNVQVLCAGFPNPNILATTRHSSELLVNTKYRYRLS